MPEVLVLALLLAACPRPAPPAPAAGSELLDAVEEELARHGFSPTGEVRRVEALASRSAWEARVLAREGDPAELLVAVGRRPGGCALVERDGARDQVACQVQPPEGSRVVGALGVFDPSTPSPRDAALRLLGWCDLNGLL